MRIHQRIFATASPKRGPALGGLTMDDPLIYGPVWHTLPYRQAVELTCVLPFKLLVVLIDTEGPHSTSMPEAEDLTKHWARTEASGATAQPGSQGRGATAREHALAAALAATMNERGCKKCISFHNRNERAKQFVKWATEFFANHNVDIAVDRVDGTEMTTRQREAVLKRLGDDGRIIIACARCLQEGVDLPSLDLACLAEPRRSTVDLIQLVGRVCRLAAGKMYGYILLPVLINPENARRLGDDEASQEDLSLVDKEFAPAVAILKALMSMDEELAGKVQRALRQIGEGGAHTDYTPPWETPMFGSFNPEKLGRSTDAARLWSLIHTKLVRLAGNHWDERFGQLTAYAASHFGSSKVPLQCRDPPGLGMWAKGQQEAFKRGDLSDAKVASLRSLNFPFNRLEEKWEEGFEEARVYLAAHHFGEAPDPQKPSPLYNWFSGQRVSFRKGDLIFETPQRYPRLCDIGFTWTIDERLFNWGVRLHKDFFRRHPDFTHLPTSRTEPVIGDLRTLRKWAARMRAQLALPDADRDEVLRFEPERVQKLRDAGIVI